MVPDGVEMQRIRGQGHILTEAPVKPVGMAGVGNSVGNVSDTFVTAVPVVA